MGTRTPWGTSDHSEKVAPGIIFYGTPSHGGYHLSPKRNAKVAEPLRRKDGWYEEDCDYARVLLTFPELFAPERVAEAKRSVKSWAPDEYTEATGEPVAVEESFILRERAKAHENDPIVTYTTAPADYDWFGTVTVEVAGCDSRGRAVRKVTGPKAHVEAQRGRYGSGLHLAVDEAEWAKLVAYKLVSVEGPAVAKVSEAAEKSEVA